MDQTLNQPKSYGGAQWQRRGASVYLEARSVLDGVDALAVYMERKWGVDRLRLLVGDDLRAKFDRQRAKLNGAIWSGDLEDVQREANRMTNAWRALDAAAEAAGAKPIAREIIAELVVGGTVIWLVADSAAAYALQGDGRRAQVWTLDEVANVIKAFPEAVKAKTTFPGAEVVWSRPPLDPLNDVMEDEIPF